MVVTLPNNFPGSPRCSHLSSHLSSYMKQAYEEAVTLFNELGHPSLFITFTGNPHWPEIQEHCKNGLTWADNPDIAARVSHQLLETSLGLHDEVQPLLETRHFG